MGQYFSAVHRRRLIDGTTIDDRRVGKRIFWFERIQNAVERYRAERLQPNSKYFVPQDEGETPPETDYRVDAYPRYHIKNQQLRLRLVNSQKNLPPKLIPWEHAATRGARGKTKTLPPRILAESIRASFPALCRASRQGQGRAERRRRIREELATLPRRRQRRAVRIRRRSPVVRNASSVRRRVSASFRRLAGLDPRSFRLDRVRR